MKPLLDRVWNVVKERRLPTHGINYVVYSGVSGVFTGVTLLRETAASNPLETRQVRLAKYGWWKHHGSFSEIPAGYRLLREELMKKGHREGLVSVEIYGHVTSDPDADMEVLIEVQP